MDESESRNHRMSNHEYLLKERLSKVRAYQSAIASGTCSGKIVLDLSNSDFYTIFAIRAYASKCYTLVSPSKRQTVQKFLEDNKCLINKNVFLIGDISEVKERVDVIIHDWSDNQVFSISNLIDLLVARDRCLAINGQLIPSEVKLEISAVSDASLISDEHQRWDFTKYRLDYDHIAKVSLGTNVLWGHLPTAEVTKKALLWHLVPIHMSLQELLQYRSPFFLEVSQDCKIHGIAVNLEVRFTARTRYRTCHQINPWTFVLSEPLQVQQGDLLQGMFSLSTRVKRVKLEMETKIKLRNVVSKLLVSEILKYDVMN